LKFTGLGPLDFNDLLSTPQNSDLKAVKDWQISDFRLPKGEDSRPVSFLVTVQTQGGRARSALGFAGPPETPNIALHGCRCEVVRRGLDGYRFYSRRQGRMESTP
jgi:hypothetical protein